MNLVVIRLESDPNNWSIVTGLGWVGQYQREIWISLMSARME